MANHEQPRPLLLRGGTVRTVDPRHATSHSLLVRDGVVADVGTDESGGGSVIDLGGRCVVPGFNDAHVHFMMWSQARRQVRLEGCRDLAEALERVREAAERHTNGGWLIGHGWRSLEWSEPVEPDRRVLDPVTGQIPVALRSKDGHSIWLNSAALSLAGDALETSGGVVILDGSGEPTGVLKETAAWRFEERLVRVSEAERIDAAREGIRVAHARGVTAIHDKDGGLGALDTWQQLRASGDLTLRVWQSFPAAQLPSLRNLGLRSGLGDGMLRAGYLKTFMDGSLGSRTAHLLAGSGVPLLDTAGLTELILDAADAGWPVAAHAIGDLANRQALDAFEATRAAWTQRGLRQRIEHAQLIHPDDVPRFARIGVAASVQFTHAPSDRDMVEGEWRDELGGAYPTRDLWESGALIANGSDAPIEELDPLLGIRAASLRSLDDRPAWRPDQSVTVAQALEASTVAPAVLTGDGDRRGRLRAGYLADLVVLDRDPVAVPADELGEVRVVATMVDGRWVHGAPPWD